MIWPFIKQAAACQEPACVQPRRWSAVAGSLAGVVLPLLLLAGCQGEIGGRGSGSGSGGPGAGNGAGGGAANGGLGGAAGNPSLPPGTVGPGSFGACQQNADPGPSPLVKLSTLQYRNTVNDLLAASGLGAMVAEVTPILASVPDDSPIDFRGLDRRVSSDHVQAYFNVAVAVGDAVSARPERLTALAGSCAATAPLTAACVDGFLARFGQRAFRRPPDAQELTSLRQLNDGVRTPADAIRAMVVSILMSPRFVNHLEVDGAPIAGREDYLQLHPFEVASRLSYTFWQSMPDDALLAAAQDGSLATDAGFAAELERVFADPRTQQTLWLFWSEWLRLESFTGFAADRPAFKALAAGQSLNEPGHDHYGDMVQELRDLTDLYTWKQKGTLADLLTSDLSVTRSADLARLYGIAPWTGTGDYPRFTDGSRAGLLQRAALLASSLEETNPFHRGSLVRRSLLCDTLPRPDPNALPPGSLDPPPPSTAETTRQRFAKKIEGNGLCAGCHGSFSDIGYVLEAYDSLGRFRTIEKVFDQQTGALLAELPVDSTAVARINLEDTRPVMGPAQLNQRIVESGKIDACLSANYFRYALRRDPTAGGADACDFEQLRGDLAKPGVGLADVFKRLAQQPNFRRRKVALP
jgi:hypothetical protein